MRTDAIENQGVLSRRTEAVLLKNRVNAQPVMFLNGSIDRVSGDV
jgi:hypothetical protein